MNIMIVDDEPKIRNGLLHLLDGRDSMHVIKTCTDGAEALEYLAEQKPDVLITDIKMPEVNGLDLIAHIREVDGNLRIIILSGYSDFNFAQRAIELGVKRYLTKPTNVRELLAVLQEIEKETTGDHLSKETKQPEVSNQLIQRSIEYIGLNYSQKITVQQLADHLYLSPNYFSELFKKNMNQTPMDYVNAYRLTKAAQLLRQSNRKVAEIADMVGFADARYFSSSFKKQFGMTPMEYRNQQKS